MRYSTIRNAFHVAAAVAAVTWFCMVLYVAVPRLLDLGGSA